MDYRFHHSSKIQLYAHKTKISLAYSAVWTVLVKSNAFANWSILIHLIVHSSVERNQPQKFIYPHNVEAWLYCAGALDLMMGDIAYRIVCFSKILLLVNVHAHQWANFDPSTMDRSTILTTLCNQGPCTSRRQGSVPFLVSAVRAYPAR